MFKQLFLKPKYVSTKDDIAGIFYNPILKHAVSYDRVSAYFSAGALASYAQGLEYFADKGNKFRLIISKDISEEDFEEIQKGYRVKEGITEGMLDSLDEELTLLQEKCLSNLAYLISIDVVEIKIAFKKYGIFHDKCGIFKDDNGNIICFGGSENETEAGIKSNYETFQIVCSWIDPSGFYQGTIDTSIEEFNSLWAGTHDEIVVLPAQEVIMKNIIKHNKGELIVDEVFLEEEILILDYDDGLIMHVNLDDIKGFIRSATFKLTIQPFVEKVEGKTVHFRDELSYIDYQRLDSKFSRKFKRKGIKYSNTRRLEDYIDSRNIHINNRARLGVTIKQQDDSILIQFEEYRRAIDEGMSRTLREKQAWDSFFMFTMERSFNFSVPGSGKTSSALGVYSFLKSKGIVNRIVMIGPKNAFGSWIDEFKVCFQGVEKLSTFNLHSSEFKSAEQKKRALKYDTGSCNLILVNYESLATYEPEIRALIGKDTLLVFDEIHKAKRIDGKIASHVMKISENAFYSIAMTGTPIPNSYLDLYNLLNILYADEYRDFFGFEMHMLKNPSDNDKSEINRKIQPFFCRTTKRELEVPQANEDIIFECGVSHEEQKLFDILCSKYYNNKLELLIRIMQLESNPKMLLSTVDIGAFSDVLDINVDDVDMIDYIDYASDVQSLIQSIDVTSKKRRCLDEVARLVKQGKKVIVWCIFVDSIVSLADMFEDKGIKTRVVYGEVPLEERFEIVEEFRKGAFDVLLTNPHTLAESVSLHTVCHDAVYFEYSYNLVHLLQSKDRIHRLGLTEDEYTQWYFMQCNYKKDEKYFSLGERIYTRLSEKENVMLDAIENHILEESTSTDEDIELIFGDLFEE